MVKVSCIIANGEKVTTEQPTHRGEIVGASPIFEKVTVIERGMIENSHDGCFIVSLPEDIGASVFDLTPEESRPIFTGVPSEKYGPAGRFEIIVRFTPEEK